MADHLDRRTVLRLLTLGAAAACASPTAAPPTVAPTSPSSPSSPSGATTSPPAPAAETTPPTATAPTPVRVDLHCRQDWRARPAGSGMQAHTIRQLTVHHSAVVASGGDGPQHLRQYQDLHMDQHGWPDIAYHVAVDRDGQVFELRPWDLVGDTGTAYDPAGHFLLLLDGNFDEQEPAPAQFDAAARVLAWASGHFAVGLDTITGHRDHAVTACPGDALYRRLDQLAAAAGGLVDSGGVELTPTC